MIFELSVLAAFGAMLCWGFGDFFIQKSTRKVGNIEALAFIGIIGSIGLLPFVVFELPLLFSFENLVLLCFVGIATLVIALFNFEALKKGKLSVVEIVFEIELPITVLLGFLFFAETLSALQMALILFILLGVGLISLSNVSKQQFLKSFEKGIAMAIIGGIGLAFLDFLTAAASRKVSPLMAIWMPFVVFTILCLLLIWRREGFKKFAGNAAKYKFTLLGMGIFDTIAWVFFAIAVFEKQLAITTAITESYPAVALLLAVCINKEKIRKHQYAGAAIALAACILLGLFA